MANKVTTVLEHLNLVDRFLFAETMESQAAYQATISILLENEIELLDKCETEKELRVSPELRQVRLDVVSMDREGKLYYTEMQQRDTGNLKKRSRYYQAQLDVSLLEPGCVDFNSLNNSCFIMVAPFDIFGKGLYRYTFEGTCRECPELKLDDGASRIFINTNGTNREDFSDEFLKFMDYITESTDAKAAESDSEKIKLIHQQVKGIRLSEKMGVKFMQEWEEKALEREDGRKEGHASGLAEGLSKGHASGITEGLQKVARNMLSSGMTVEEVSKLCELSEEEVEKLKQT